MAMQLWRHVAYQSVGDQIGIVNQLFRGETPENSSGFTEPDTEIHRNVMTVREIRAVSLMQSGCLELAIEGAADDGLERLFVGGILYFAHVALGTVGLERKELLFE
jgi:hypothetical protein